MYDGYAIFDNRKGGLAMDQHMDTIISQLSHIESTAVRIMESADHQKKELELEMEQQIKNYDNELAARTQEQLDELKETLNQQKESSLLKLTSETKQELSDLETRFQKNHSLWAKEILASIIGVSQ